MKKYLALTLVFLLISCGGIKREDLAKLNGYWEIEKATMPGGSEKVYSPAMLVDYVHFDGASGYRQKVVPRLDGKFISNGVKETVTAHIEKGKVTLLYNSGFSKWKEELRDVSEDHFTTRNKSGLTCQYKKYEPIDLK